MNEDAVDVECRNARAEAQARVGAIYEVRVLEPSPPASTDPQWFADDPVARGDAGTGHPIISPVGTGDERWIDLTHDDPELAGFCMTRWLGPYKRLEPLADGWDGAQRSLHRVATWILAPARRRANGKIGLRWTLGGIGTPFFGDDEQVRVDGTALVHQVTGSCRAAPLTTLADAAAFLDLELDPATDHGFADVVELGDVDAPLALDERAALALGDWFGFTWSVLVELRAELGDRGPSRVQLWPEHFDAAFDAAGPDGLRANLGCSPGDAADPEPYCYVGPWEQQQGVFWNASFGAVLRYRDLLAADDQRDRALAFYREGLALL